MSPAPPTTAARAPIPTSTRTNNYAASPLQCSLFDNPAPDHALPGGPTAVGRTNRLRTRASQELALDGVGAPDPHAGDGGRTLVALDTFHRHALCGGGGHARVGPRRGSRNGGVSADGCADRLPPVAFFKERALDPHRSYRVAR